MRLSKIKLAGFKSFVDPTTISLDTNLTGVVGPNGCGKSNIIDAVRWVMGEISAKQIRGDSMSDVIFNGSSARQPVGTASIELLFDNSEGRAGGQYASFTEISVKRTVERDGVSAYALNGTRCRRKDITELFLGTGLGPRSYAIIEQGMISRLIDAKPDELRVYLEEAAGISKYKEKRRETENRIRHTRDNLSRLADLREEVDKQLAHLQRQARAADRYKRLQEELRRVRAESLLLRLQLLRDEGDARARLEAEHSNKVEAARAEQRAVEAELEKARESQEGTVERFNAAQADFYRLGADVATVEQAIQHGRELRKQREEELAQSRHQREELTVLLKREQDHRSEHEQVIAELEPGLERATGEESAAVAGLSAAEERMHDWQTRWDSYAARSGETSQISQVQRTAIEHLETRERTLLGRLDRIEQERGVFDPVAQQAQVDEASATDELLTKRLLELQARCEQDQAGLSEHRDQERELSKRLDAARTELQSAQGRLASLEALQQAALGGDSGGEWLRGQSLEEAPRLAERLAVDDGWERAVETVLGGYLEAVCVDGLDGLMDAAGELEEGRIALIDGSGEVAGAAGLSAKVRGPGSVVALLEGVEVAEDLAAARSMLGSLSPGRSVVTRDGLWLGRDWLRVTRHAADEGGVIGREQEIRELQARVAELGARVRRDGEAHEDLGLRLNELEARRDEGQAELNRLNRESAGAKAHLDALRARRDESDAKRSALDEERAEVRTALGLAGEELKASRGQLEGALGDMAELEDERQGLLAERDSLREALDAARTAAQSAVARAQELRVRLEASRSALGSTVRGLERLEAQSQQLATRQEELQAALAVDDTPEEELRGKLDRLLAERQEAEQGLGAARDRVEAGQARIRGLDGDRSERERQVQTLREGLEAARLEARESRVRAEDVAEQLAETGVDEQELAAELPEDATLAAWQERSEGIERRIERIGSVNLAAIDEFEEQSQRKEYLDAQHGDLVEALDTLENAIRRIDRETRTRFKETFDKVNAGLKSRFPRLFGGGHAYLELVGDDLLEAGVAIMARPPGKRNSTIHLLSGGEKALTASALVFAIFDLNPAPFCMLDEVDAPLDDANVSRFCELVKEMSERVQIVLITHNKVTMEMTSQLTGVTMSEPGVSRLVAVDLDAAVQLAEAG